MRYRLVAVGKLKRGFAQVGCERYAKLLQGLAPLEVVEIRDQSASGSEEARRRHGRDSLAAGDGHLVLLDELGSSFSTSELAAWISELELRGHSRLTLFVGGPDGHGEELRRAAHASLALSRLTFPHDLARLMLLEQLYRVESLRAGHPYHRT